MAAQASASRAMRSSEQRRAPPASTASVAWASRRPTKPEPRRTPIEAVTSVAPDCGRKFVEDVERDRARRTEREALGVGRDHADVEVARCPASRPTTRARLPATRRSPSRPSKSKSIGAHRPQAVGSVNTSRTSSARPDDGGLFGPGAHGGHSSRAGRRSSSRLAIFTSPPDDLSLRSGSSASRDDPRHPPCGRCAGPGAALPSHRCARSPTHLQHPATAGRRIAPDRQDLLFGRDPAGGRCSSRHGSSQRDRAAAWRPRSAVFICGAVALRRRNPLAAVRGGRRGDAARSRRSAASR